MLLAGLRVSKSPTITVTITGLLNCCHHSQESSGGSTAIERFIHVVSSSREFRFPAEECNQHRDLIAKTCTDTLGGAVLALPNPQLKIKGAGEMRQSGMESPWDSFSYLVRKNMSPEGKCCGSDILRDAQGISLLVPGRTINTTITWRRLAGNVSQNLIPLPGEQRNSGNPLQPRLGGPAQIP